MFSSQTECLAFRSQSMQSVSATRLLLCRSTLRQILARESNSPKKKKNEHNHQDEAETAGRIVSPPATVGPRRKCTDEQHNEYDEQYGAEWHWSSPLGSVRLQRSWRERLRNSFLTADQSKKFLRLNSATSCCAAKRNVHPPSVFPASMGRNIHWRFKMRIRSVLHTPASVFVASTVFRAAPCTQ